MYFRGELNPKLICQLEVRGTQGLREEKMMPFVKKSQHIPTMSHMYNDYPRRCWLPPLWAGSSEWQGPKTFEKGART